MKSYISKITILAILALSFAGSLSAQLKSNYFLDNSFHRMELNPALQPSRGYFSIGLANFSPEVSTGPFSLDRVFEMKSDEYLDVRKFTTFLKDKNPVSATAHIQPFGLGFYTGKIFWNLSVSLKDQATISVPKSLFEIIANGSGTYSLKDLTMQNLGYGEMGIGASFPIGNKLTVGAKFKYLAGLAYVENKFDQFDVRINENVWDIKMNGRINASINNGPQLAPGEVEIEDYTDNIEGENLMKKFNNKGMAFDLGATYKLLDNLTLSLALTDLGSISWKKDNNVIMEINNYEASFFDSEKSANSLEENLDNLPEVKLNSVEATTFKTKLNSKLNAGAEYSVLSNKISFGALYSKQSGINAMSSMTFSTNLKPMKVFNAALTYTTGSFGTNAFGAAVNWTPKWFMNFFVATDYIITKVSPDYIPVSAKRANFQFGISIPLRSRRADVSKAIMETLLERPTEPAVAPAALTDTLPTQIKDTANTILPDSISPLKADSLKSDSLKIDSITPVLKDSVLKTDSVPVLKSDSTSLNNEVLQGNPTNTPVNQQPTPTNPQEQTPKPAAVTNNKE